MIQKQLEPLFGYSPDKITMIKFVFYKKTKSSRSNKFGLILTPCSPIHDFKCISIHMCEEYFYIIYIILNLFILFNPNFCLLTNPSSYTKGDNRYIYDLDLKT